VQCSNEITITIINMGRKFRVAGSPCNTMWKGLRPTCLPSFILIRPTVWPQFTNVTDRQTDRQRTDSTERTVLQTVAQKRFALCYQTVICLYCLYDCNVRALWPNGCTDQYETWHAGRPRRWPQCVRWGFSSPSHKGAQPPPRQFSAHICYG